MIFVVLQVIAGSNPGGQVTFITTLTYLFLAGAAVLYVAVLTKRASPRLLAYEFRQNGGQFVQVLWRPKRNRMIGAQTGDQVGTKWGPSWD